MTEKSAGAQGVLAALGERFRDAATVKVVFGEPVAAAGKTVIPVARVAFGFGGGASPARRRHVLGESAGTGTEEEASGGGGGVVATPVGVVEIDQEGTRFVRFAQELHLGLAFGAGLLLGLALARRRRRDDED